MALAAGLHQVHHGPPTAPHLGIFKAASCFLSLDSRWVSGVHQLEPVEKLGYDFDTSNLNLDIFRYILSILIHISKTFSDSTHSFQVLVEGVL